MKPYHMTLLVLLGAASVHAAQPTKAFLTRYCAE